MPPYCWTELTWEIAGAGGRLAALNAGEGPVDGTTVGAAGGYGCCPIEANGSLLAAGLEK